MWTVKFDDVPRNCIEIYVDCKITMTYQETVYKYMWTLKIDDVPRNGIEIYVDCKGR